MADLRLLLLGDAAIATTVLPARGFVALAHSHGARGLMALARSISLLFAVMRLRGRSPSRATRSLLRSLAVPVAGLGNTATPKTARSGR
jgi:hypothetical protein